MFIVQGLPVIIVTLVHNGLKKQHRRLQPCGFS